MALIGRGILFALIGAALVNIASATDGTLGATSTGTVEVSLHIESVPEPQIQISRLRDIDFGAVAVGVAPTPQGSIACVHSPTGELYSIEISSFSVIEFGEAGTGDGIMASPSAPDVFISYDWKFEDDAGGIVETSLGNDLQSNPIANCNSGALGRITITPDAVPTRTPIPAGAVFSDTITLTVSPE